MPRLPRSWAASIWDRSGQHHGAVTGWDREDPDDHGDAVQPWFEFTLAAMVAQQANVQARLDIHRVGMHLSDVQRSILTLFDGSDSLTTAHWRALCPCPCERCDTT